MVKKTTAAQPLNPPTLPKVQFPKELVELAAKRIRNQFNREEQGRAPNHKAPDRTKVQVFGGSEDTSTPRVQTSNSGNTRTISVNLGGGQPSHFDNSAAQKGGDQFAKLAGDPAVLQAFLAQVAKVLKNDATAPLIITGWGEHGAALDTMNFRMSPERGLTAWVSRAGGQTLYVDENGEAGPYRLLKMGLDAYGIDTKRSAVLLDTGNLQVQDLTYGVDVPLYAIYQAGVSASQAAQTGVRAAQKT